MAKKQRQHFETEVKADDGVRLYAQGWEPEGKPLGVIVLVHGLGEHSGRYSLLGSFFNIAGFVLMAMDLRGHGKSPGKRGHAPSMDQMVNDLRALVQRAEELWEGVPVVAYGHSFGGNLLASLLVDDAKLPPVLKAAVLSAPTIRVAYRIPGWKISLGRFMNRIYPGFSMSNGIDVYRLSRDPVVREAYRKDPLVHDRVSTVVGIGLLDRGVELLDRGKDIKRPVFVIHGADDRVTSPQASLEFAKRAGDHVKHKLYYDFFHELHNDFGKEKVMNDVTNWIREQVRGEKG